jgi:phage-related holin
MLKIKGKAAVDLSKGLKLGNALKQHGSRLMIQILLLQILMKVPFINKAWQKVEQHLHVSKAFMPISKGIFILFLLMVARLREGKFGDMNVRVKRVVN